MSDVADSVVVMISGTGVAVTVHLDLRTPALFLVAVLGVLLLLISALTLVAVYDPNAQRRASAEKVLDRLLVSLRADRRRGR